MAKYASIKTRPRTEAKPSPGTLAHNQRLAKNIDLLPTEHQQENYHMNRLSNVSKVFQEWKIENEERYQKINNRKLRSDAHRLESLAIILSGEQVKECDSDAIWEKAQEFKTFFEEKYKTKVRTMDWHRDEGHINDEGKAEINDHIHLEFDNVNFEGKMVRKLFSKGDLIKFQDKIAEIYKPLGFVRGENTAKKNHSDKPKIGLPQKTFKKRKRAQASTNTPAKIKDLKTEIARLRTQLQAQKAERAEYAALEQLNIDLKEKIKAKELTIDELKAKMKEVEAVAYKTNNEKIYLGGKLLGTAKQVSYKELYEEALQAEPIVKTEIKEVEIEKIVYQEDTTRIEALETKTKTLEQTITNKENENTLLKTQNEALEAKIATLPSMDTAEELKTLKIDFEKVNSEHWKLYSLAYDENHVGIAYNEYGEAYDRLFSYKERYEQSTEALTEQKEKMDKKDEAIKELNEGYDQIENALFGDTKERSVEEIVEEKTITSRIISHVSKYLNIGLEKLRKLFKDDVPDKAEVTKDHKPGIRSALSNNPSSTGGGMKP